eukprot:2945445-Rhodomonas_salina.1
MGDILVGRLSSFWGQWSVVSRRLSQSIQQKIAWWRPSCPFCYKIGRKASSATDRDYWSLSGRATCIQPRNLSQFPGFAPARACGRSPEAHPVRCKIRKPQSIPKAQAAVNLFHGSIDTGDGTH